MTLRTTLHDRHVAIGGRMVDFAGWRMPVLYQGIKEEHRRVRSAAGLFDLGHMARIRVTGPGRETLVQRLWTNDVLAMAREEARYGLLCNAEGGVIDDLVVYRLEEKVLVVANASNRERVLDHLARHAAEVDARVEDRTFDVGMVAIQGPVAASILSRITDVDLAAIAYYRSREGYAAGQEVRISRTGYTGEDGFEIYVGEQGVGFLWDALMDAGAPDGIVPVGLGARDTLRLEAAMPLYGHELTEETDPYAAGLGFAIKLDKAAFLGRDALAAVQAAGPARRLVCFVVESKRVVREGYPVFQDGEEVGRVSSGSYSPTLDRNIGMAHVRADLREPGTRLAAEVRGERVPIVVVKRPFYKRPG